MMYFKKIKKQSKIKEVFKSPKDLSNFIKDKLTQKYSDMFEKIEVSKNNFILFLLKDNYLLEEINKILKNDIKVETN